MVVDGRGDDDGAVAAWQLLTRTRNSKRLDTKTSTRHDDATANSTKQIQKRLCKAQIGSDGMN